MKRVLKRLTGAPVGPVPPVVWLTAVAGVVVLLGWSALRDPVSALVRVPAGHDTGVGQGFDAGDPGSQDLRPGGPLLTGAPPDEAGDLLALDEASLRLQVRTLTAGGGDACPDPVAEAGGAELRASPRLAARPQGDGTGDDPCRSATRTPFGAEDGSGAAGR